jgi:flagellar motility protein MotE (MotC chaperone)
MKPQRHARRAGETAAHLAYNLTVAVLALFAHPMPATAQQGWETVVAAAQPERPAPSVKLQMQQPVAPAAAVPSAGGAERQGVTQTKPTISGPAAEIALARRPAETPMPETSAARQYCINIVDAATDAKFAWQRKTLAEAEQEIAKRLALLEEKTAEYQKWVLRRDEFVKKARDTLTLIYSRVRPDAAALQLMAMDEETAAAVLIKLDPRVASAILNEMEPTQAARLTATISGSTRMEPKPAKPAPDEEGKS